MPSRWRATEDAGEIADQATQDASRTEADVGKSERETEGTEEEVSRQKGPGHEKSGGPVGSGRSVEEVSESAEDPKRGGGASAIGALGLGGEVPSAVVNELAATIGLPEDQLDEITPQQLSLPVYGNYCGRDHGDPTGETPPIDAVDAVCREHDLCYGLLGDFNSQCDRNLIESMPNAIAITPSPIGKKAGLLVLLYFSLAERNLALGETFFKGT